MSIDAPAAWPKIRAYRSAPPGLASEGQRRAIFNAALEQSEQLFSAARMTAAAARPLLLFYGLSQAGRAIVAAYGSDASQSGHGIAARATSGPISEVAIRDKGRGLFQAVAEVVRSPTLPDGASFLQIYAGLPASVEVHLDVGDFATVLQLIPPPLESGAVLLMSSNAEGILVGLPPPRAGVDPREQVTTFLKQYPTLEGWSFVSDPLDPLRLVEREGQWVVRLRWQVDPETRNPNARDRHERVVRAGTVVPGSDGLHVLPSIKQGDSPVAPIISWWALLFAASMVARYEPGAWLETLSVDRSPVAAPIETLLDVALTQVPALILASMSDPTHWLTL